MQHGRKHGFFRRLCASVLASVLSLSLAVPAFTSTAYAASGGTLTVELYDAETGSGIPQGLARMQARNLVAYDVTEFYEWEKVYVVDQETGQYVPKLDENGQVVMQRKVFTNPVTGSVHTWAGGGFNLNPLQPWSGDDNVEPDRWKRSCLEAHADKIYLTGDLVGMSTGTSMVFDAGRNKLQEGHRYVILDLDDASVNSWFYLPQEYNMEGADPSGTCIGFYAAITWTGASQTLKLYNYPARGGFTFSVHDVETDSAALQTMGFPEASVFAVFNINSTALSPDSYETLSNAKMGRLPDIKSSSKTTTGTAYGQVRVKGYDQNGNLYYGNSTQAYSYDTVMNAYKAYLAYSNNHYYTEDELAIVGYLSDSDSGINYYNGAYGCGDYPVESNLQYGDMRTGMFTMNGVKPVAMLMADANGKVSTGDCALPAGNYLVLQVKAPSGYYIDENFRLAVSIGMWYYNNDIDITTDPSRWGSRGTGFGNALFSQLSYTARDTGLLAQSLGKGVGYQVLEDWPAVFVACGGNTDLSGRYNTSNFDFGVDRTGGITSSTPTNADDQVSYSLVSGVIRGMGNDGEYLVNSNSVGSRRYPKSGYSRVTAYMAPVRGGVSLRLADKDGILSVTGNASVGYDFDGQGDAKLDGITFRLYHDRAVGHDQNGAFVENAAAGIGWRLGANTGYTSYLGLPGMTGTTALTNNKDANWENGSGSYKEYTAFRYGSGEYILNIPVDELPFGEYTLVQVASSDGYGDGDNAKWAAHIYEELAVAQIRVVGEDKVYIRYGGKDLNEFNVDPAKVQSMIDKYTVGSTTYLPQTVYRDDASISVSTRDGNDAGISAEITVYNISDRLVIMDGSEIATAKAYYDAISGMTMNMASLKQYTSSDAWSRAKIWSGTVSAGGIQTQGLSDLPFGTYLVAVTAVNGGTGEYAPVGGAAVTFQIRPGQTANVAISVADKAAIPEITSSLFDATNGTKSVTVMTGGALIDKIQLSNLQNGVNYVAYGILTDKATGQILTGSKILGYKAGAYGGSGGQSVSTESELSSLRDMGRIFEDQAKSSLDVFSGEAYFTWLMNVDSKIKALTFENGSEAVGFKQAILDLTDRMLDMNVGASYRTLDNNTRLVVYLNSLVRHFSGSDDLTGTAAYDFRYENLDFSKLEGRTVVAYVFVCEAAELDQNVLNATTLQAARTAMGSALAAEHASVANLEQTAYIPYLDISVTSGTGSASKMAPSDSIRAIVSYQNLETDTEYKITGTVKDANGVVVTGSDGSVLTAETVFTPTGASGSVELVFEDLKSGLEGSRLTVYADLSRVVSLNGASQAYLLISKGDGSSMGWNVKDPSPGKNQIDVVKSGVATVLTDSYGNKSTDLKASSVRLRDTVTYTDLIIGERYASVLTLFYPNGDPVLDYSGREVRAVTQFTARRDTETVYVDVTYDGRNLKDKTVIAFNDLLLGGSDGPVVVSEHDLDAESQTVTDNPSSSRFYFQTSVKDDTTGTRYTLLGSAVGITDSVLIQGLDANEDYVLKTEIADAKTGSILGQIPSVTSNVKSGETGVISQDVKLTINTTGMSGRTLVVYQTLYNHDGTTLVVSHADPNDSAQMLFVPGIDTFASGADGSSKSVMPEQIEHVEVNVTANGDGTLRTDEKITYTYEAAIRDRVDYTNLTPGGTYTVQTQVVPAGGGAALAELTTKLSPMDASGSLTVDLNVDVTKVMGKSVVVYETITDDYSGKIILQHQDPDDADQTVAILIPGESDGLDGSDSGDGVNGTGTGSDGVTIGDGAVPKGDGANIQTGVAENYVLFLALGGLFLALSIAGGVYTWKRYRK